MSLTTAPGKLIISGEHAVVYGQPALAAAINCFATCEIEPNSGNDIEFILPQFSVSESASFDALMQRHSELTLRYARFNGGDLKIGDVLRSPLELLQFALGSLFEKAGVLPASGFKVTVTSEVPASCGLGSSAAVIVSVIVGMLQSLGLEIDEEELFRLALDVENLQHGRSSGVDVFVSLKGGCIAFKKSAASQKASFEKVALGTFPIVLVDTGRPECTTGESVTKVAESFKESSIWSTFGAVTERVRTALESGDSVGLKSAIAENHQLLMEIGVVPKRVQEFVKFLESEGAAGKITGAGAVSGESAGMLLVVGDTDVSHLAAKFGYSMQAVIFEGAGVRTLRANAG